jgi:hypothetical protein
MKVANLINSIIPEFGVPDEMPLLPDELYAVRYALLVDRVKDAGLGALIVYGDRERSSNISYLTGWDPRFEEALLVHVPGRPPTVITGPENTGFASAVGLRPETILYPPFGVPGSDRSHTPALMDIFAELGIVAGMTVGVVGGKYFSPSESATPEAWIDAPAFFVDVLRQTVGTSGRVVNATTLLSSPSNGLRSVNEIDQLARFEFASSYSSQAIRDIMFGIRPGMREFDVARLMRQIGLPLSCHPMLASGPRAKFGLNSPSDRKIERGDPVSFAYGLWGGFNNRAGWVVEDASELPTDAADYVDAIAAPFYGAMARWYETIDIGVTGGELDAVARQQLDGFGIDLFLNPGHLIHHEEWLGTPIYPGSTERLRSGQAVQCDMLPIAPSGGFSAVMEDGVLLLDAAGRSEFAERYPAAWERIRTRRDFMIDTLGIRLQPSVLPTSNIPAFFPPFLLSPNTILSCR